MPLAELVEGRGTDQGEHRGIATGSDTVPKLGRDTVRARSRGLLGVRAADVSSFRTSSSEVRAVCGKSARTVSARGVARKGHPCHRHYKP